MKKLLLILILFCSLQGFGQIKGYWMLNGNSNDYSGNGNNGIDTNIAYSQGYGLLNQGANPVLNDGLGRIPLALAKEKGNQEIIGALEAQPISSDTCHE